MQLSRTESIILKSTWQNHVSPFMRWDVFSGSRRGKHETEHTQCERKYSAPFSFNMIQLESKHIHIYYSLICDFCS